MKEVARSIQTFFTELKIDIVALPSSNYNRTEKLISIAARMAGAALGVFAFYKFALISSAVMKAQAAYLVLCVLAHDLVVAGQNIRKNYVFETEPSLIHAINQTYHETAKNAYEGMGNNSYFLRNTWILDPLYTFFNPIVGA